MLVWSIMFVIFSAVEIAVPALVSVWFALSSICMIFISIFVKDVYLQILIFSLLSVVFMVCLRTYFKRFLHNKKDILSNEVIVLELMSEESDGSFLYKVKYKGSVWTAISNEKISINSKAFIEAFEGNKIKIKLKK